MMRRQRRCWRLRPRLQTPSLPAAQLCQVPRIAAPATGSYATETCETAKQCSHQSAGSCLTSLFAMCAGQPLSGTLTLWNTRSFKRVGSLPAGRVPVSSLAFSPDGKLLAAATTDSMAQLFSPHSREPVSGWPVIGVAHSANLLNPNVVLGLALTRAPAYVTGGASKTLTNLIGNIWQVGGRHGGQASIVWVPGGHIAATLSEDGQLQTWDLQNPAAPALLDAAAVAASGQHAACMVASPDCTRLALAAGARVTMVHISAQGCLSVSNKPVLQLRSDVAHDGGAFRIDWHKDGELLVCTDGGAAVIVRV